MILIVISRIRWVDRKFNFDFEEGMFPAIVGRLKGTPARLEDLVAGFPAELLTKKLKETWSIQEQVGHLLDLEPLHIGRLDDFLESADRLRPADMSNQKTHEAHHNDTSIDTILLEFRNIRTGFVKRLDQLGSEDVIITSLHPRLNKPMRLVDMIYFTAEHDDHHIATMIELAQKLNK